MLPIISIIGWSNSGKTTFITELIPELKKRGYKVATIKHNAHKFEIDKPGKDSWQHRKAGAETVVLSSQEKVAMIREIAEEINIEKLVKQYIEKDYDIVIVEGNKTADYPQIEIFRPEIHKEPIISEAEVTKRIINEATNEFDGSYRPEKINSVVNIIEQLIENKKE